MPHRRKAVAVTFPNLAYHSGGNREPHLPTTREIREDHSQSTHTGRARLPPALVQTARNEKSQHTSPTPHTECAIPFLPVHRKPPLRAVIPRTVVNRTRQLAHASARRCAMGRPPDKSLEVPSACLNPTPAQPTVHSWSSPFGNQTGTANARCKRPF